MVTRLIPRAIPPQTAHKTRPNTHVPRPKPLLPRPIAQSITHICAPAHRRSAGCPILRASEGWGTALVSSPNLQSPIPNLQSTPLLATRIRWPAPPGCPILRASEGWGTALVSSPNLQSTPLLATRIRWPAPPRPAIIESSFGGRVEGDAAEQFTRVRESAHDPERVHRRHQADTMGLVRRRALRGLRRPKIIANHISVSTETDLPERLEVNQGPTKVSRSIEMPTR